MDHKLTYGTYGNLPYCTEKEELDTYDYLIVGIPYDTKAHVRAGARRGPAYIRENSRLDRFVIGEDTDLSVVRGADAGDAAISQGDEEKNRKVIFDKTKESLDTKAAPIILGGDHSITYHELRAYKEKYGPVAVISISGHTGMNPLKEYPDSSAFLFQAIREELVDVKHSVQIGARDLLTDTISYEKRADGYYQNDLRVISTYELRERGISEIAGEIAAIVKGLPVFVSFAPDFIDPAFAPAVVDPVADGFTSYQALQFLKEMLQYVKPVGFDLTDISPVYDAGRITQVLLSDIVNEFIGCIAKNRMTAEGMDEEKGA